MYVVLFDGVCNLCNAWVNRVIDLDKKDVFRFASLQSNYGRQMVEKYNPKGAYMDSILLIDDNRMYERSTAVLRIAKHLGGIHAIAYAFIIVPVFIRDAVYNFVAKNRYRWFGKRETCRIPTPELKAKFIE